MQKFHLTVQGAKERLAGQSAKPFIALLQHGTMRIEYFVPRDIDTQQPHEQNELYCIASGKAVFYRYGERMEASTGDCLFVPAGMEHRFENFSADFATWVVFYGPRGGENSPSV